MTEQDIIEIFEIENNSLYEIVCELMAGNAWLREELANTERLYVLANAEPDIRGPRGTGAG